MSDDGREGQHKADRRLPSAGSLFDPTAKAAQPGSTPPAGEPVAPVSTPAAPEPPFAGIAMPAHVSAAPTDRVQSARPEPYAPVVRPATPYAPAVEPMVVDLDDDLNADEGLDDGLDEEDFPPTLVEQIRRLQPAPVILTICSVGAFLFLARAMTSHTTPVPVLMSAGVVTSLVFGIDAGVASVGTWRASQDGRTGRGLLLATLGGFAALISAGAFSGVLVMVLVLNV
jgi:hypothetical protein